ncbi:hypothetical protein KR767_00535 [Luteibacter anthropi]|uniref:Uncharacterized protein n=1 Tax=Luteibacter anthropi TaxID=564369 RepID=A0A7X5ZHS5_9GAMM|nr:hypothetical protein [Luteibacter anthropi]NII06112.1 hypothetical protein [Luteibacter anthropi]URX62613.1 hypothetical protein KR767_00535 [Luteibacter anthropi]
MPRSLTDYLPWIAIVLAVIVAAVYFDTQSRAPEPDTYESCIARLTATDQSEADRALNRSICAGKPKAPASSSTR